MSYIQNISNTKSSIRKRVREKLSTLSESDYAAHAHKLSMHLTATSWFMQAKHIAVYFPKDKEIDTRPFIKASWNMNKILYLPVVSADKNKPMPIIRYTPGTKLVEGAYQLLIPQHDDRSTCSVAMLDLVIVPLVAFDSRYHRLGRGGGHYDRLLSACRATTRIIGVAHSMQEIDTIPISPYDISMNSIITEKGVL